MPPTDLLAPLREHPETSALLFDFDGTLSPIVADPAAAAPSPGVVDLLTGLAASYRTVAIVSGRPMAFLARHLPPELTLSGLYGLEARRDGESIEHGDADRWRPVVADAAAQLDALAVHGGPLAGATVEPKGLSITVHTRQHPELAPAVADAAASLAATTGLEVRSAKRSVELHPPIAADKGSALLALADGADRVLYVGDDVGDLPAFEALVAWRDEAPGRVGLVVAVGGEELADSVRDRADVVLADQGEVVDLLRALHP